MKAEDETLGSDFSNEYILGKIHFQEQFFQGELYR